MSRRNRAELLKPEARPPSGFPCCRRRGRQDSNLQPPVLETGALPIEPRPWVAGPSVASGPCSVALSRLSFPDRARTGGARRLRVPLRWEGDSGRRSCGRARAVDGGIWPGASGGRFAAANRIRPMTTASRVDKRGVASETPGSRIEPDEVSSLTPGAGAGYARPARKRFSASCASPSNDRNEEEALMQLIHSRRTVLRAALPLALAALALALPTSGAGFVDLDDELARATAGHRRPRVGRPDGRPARRGKRSRRPGRVGTASARRRPYFGSTALSRRA